MIGWKPADADRDLGDERRLPRWFTGVLVVAAAFVVVFAAYAGFSAWRFAHASDQASVESLDGVPVGSNLRSSLMTRSRAEFSREAASRAFENVRKAPSDHPAVLRRLIELQGRLSAADRAFGDGDYAQAVRLYEATTKDTKTFADELEDMRKAREGYDQFLVDVQRLEKFKSIAPATFNEAVAAAGSAIQFLDSGSFTLARQKVEEASRTLHSIETTLAEETERTLSAGRAALARGDGRAANIAFTRVLELQPGNAVAIKGLERAKSIDRVFELIGQAEDAEKAGRLEDAQKLFEQAFAMDGLSATAQAGVSRVKAAIRDRDFAAALARAKAARDKNDWEAVIKGYEDALKLFPDNADVKKDLADARVRQREAFIQRSLADAYEAERKHDWNAARDIYMRLIDFEPGQADANEGLLRTGKVLRALLKFERLLEEARSNAQRADFQGAIMNFNEAMASKPSYLALTPDQEQLKNLLEQQSRPVEVTFVSDGRTYVTVNGVKILGRFQKTSIPILPGNYEVVGRRRGYREVREVLRVRAQDNIPPVTIVATQRN